MSDSNQELERMSPEGLLKTFSATSLRKALMLAIGVHVVVVLLTSVNYIWTSYIVEPPPSAEEPAEDDATDGAPGGVGTNATADAAASGSGTNAAGTATNAVAGDDDPQAAALRDRSDSKVVREITEVAAPDEIPDEPDDLGLPLDATNPF